MFFILIRNFGEQIKPIPELNGLKFNQKGKENTTEKTRIIKIGFDDNLIDCQKLFCFIFAKKMIKVESKR